MSCEPNFVHCSTIIFYVVRTPIRSLAEALADPEPTTVESSIRESPCFGLPDHEGDCWTVTPKEHGSRRIDVPQ